MPGGPNAGDLTGTEQAAVAAAAPQRSSFGASSGSEMSSRVRVCRQQRSRSTTAGHCTACHEVSAIFDTPHPDQLTLPTLLKDIPAIMADADPKLKAKVYSDLGIKITYEPGSRIVVAEARLA